MICKRLNGKYQIKIILIILLISNFNGCNKTENDEDTKTIIGSESRQVDIYSDEYLEKLDKNSRIFFDKALREKNLDEAKAFLHKCILGNHVQEVTGFTPLHYAVQSGVPELVEYVLEHKVGINAKDEKGWTSLHHVCGDGFDLDYYSGSILVEDEVVVKTTITKALLNHGAEIDVKDKKGRTPLHLATYMRYEPVAELLRQHGAKK